MNSVRLKVTHYGESNDPDHDPLSRQWIGNVSNPLNTSSCALTVRAQEMLGAKEHALLKIVFSEKLVFYRTFDDRAPEADPRCDLFNPFNNLNPCPDFADVSVVEVKA